jgi:hypothetical protein
MKKLVLITFVFFLAIGVNAQSFGLRFGYTMSGLRIDDNFADYLDVRGVEGKLTDGVNIGLVFEKAIKPKIDLHAELNFAQKGSAYDMYANEANHGTSGYGQTNLNYFELPIMAKIKFGPAYFAVGPHIGYLIGAQEIKYRENDLLVAAYGETAAAAALGVTSLQDTEFFDSDLENFNRFDFGGQFSLGGQAPVGKVKIFAEARATVAFTNWETWNTYGTDQETYNLDYKKNMAFTFAVGVLFNKPQK